jgi:geranylgeranyl pyrophosphate synthase
VKNSNVDVSATMPSAIFPADSWTIEGSTGDGECNSRSDLPIRERWGELLGVEHCAALESVLRSALIEPVSAAVSGRGKRIRSQLVFCSYRLFQDDEAARFTDERCRLAAEAVEFIHAGSLVVDDIEDGSKVRRGRPSLHLRFPMPLALNAGNWLYFWPFQILREIAVPQHQLQQIYESYHRTLLRAHFGQAIDLGAHIDSVAQDQVAALCMAAMRLKTGALMGFAASLGAALTGIPLSILSIVEDFGTDLGVALQMFDDLGNAIGQCEPAKRYEDLMLSHPSWVWACAARSTTPAEYAKFLSAVGKLPDNAGLERWLAEHEIIPRTRQTARAQLDLSLDALQARLSGVGRVWSRRAFAQLRDLGEEVAVAYR